LKQIPDLAVEVVFSSGSIEDLEKYQKLGVKEVWFWINERLEIYILKDDNYQEQNSSYNLANLDCKLLEKYISQVLNGNPRILKKAFLQEIS
jgi:Uma2 family endonuclease